MKALTELVNRAYAAAEVALWKADKERIGVERLTSIVAAGDLAVARSGERIVGCVRIRMLEDGAGFFGLLAVDPAAQGAGAGTELVGFAERLARERGASEMELRVLTPRQGSDSAKDRLREWYSRLGYRMTQRCDFSETHPDEKAAMRVPLDIVTYRKRL
jgi:GNAT superfamily N-acetyltransferase